MSTIKPKRNTNTSNKPKITRKKIKNNENKIQYILIFIIIFLTSIIISFGAYIYLTSQDTPTQTKQLPQKDNIQQQVEQKVSKEYKQDILDQKIEDIKEKLKTKQEIEPVIVESIENETIIDELPKHEQYSTDYKDTPETVVVIEPKKPIIKGVKPKLAIVIDDVVYESQVKALKSLGYPINMSFLPPTPDHPNSSIIAKSVSKYMIHLPLEAMTFSKEEENTLHMGDNITKIDERIQELKKYYPKAKYINNHTGSRFTSDEESMDKLMFVLKKHNLIFLDSKTTAKTVAHKYAKIHKVPFLSRDVFLDNVQEFDYIQKQLKHAITLAKQRGYSIIIGHPYRATIEVLKASAHLLKDVEVVYIDELPLL
ncbi:MAG: divergent polysaccharide deacetylase family protein [Arcobacteraceae bacterium]|nr:divergent polysaccharide deacetylase family protein [Arcobacteraceae bacterium]